MPTSKHQVQVTDKDVGVWLLTPTRNPDDPNAPASALTARWWPTSTRRRPHREEEAKDDEKDSELCRRAVPAQWLGNRRKGHPTMGRLEIATMSAPRRSTVVGPDSQSRTTGRKPAAKRVQESATNVTCHSRSCNVECPQHVDGTTLAKCDLPPMDVFSGSWRDFPPS